MTANGGIDEKLAAGASVAEAFRQADHRCLSSDLVLFAAGRVVSCRSPRHQQEFVQATRAQVSVENVNAHSQTEGKAAVLKNSPQYD